jgi:predicted  nucleic acid-binding Zn-ribbon protein
MKKIRHTCGTCESEFVIEYNEMVCEDSPTYCPFCSEYMIQDELDIEDE